jgi:hypothetical protein
MAPRDLGLCVASPAAAAPLVRSGGSPSAATSGTDRSSFGASIRRAREDLNGPCGHGLGSDPRHVREGQARLDGALQHKAEVRGEVGGLGAVAGGRR